jgi:iron(III) transport system ATP-binding protein
MAWPGREPRPPRTDPNDARVPCVGPSGSGKTTLLRLIAGFDTPDGGSSSLDGMTIVDNRQSVPAHRRGIGVIALNGALFPRLSVGENIGFGIDRGKGPRDQPEIIVDPAPPAGADRAVRRR